MIFLFRSVFFSIILSFLCLISLKLIAQVPTPALPQSQTIIIKNATIHVGNGKVLNHHFIRIEKGKIVAVQEDVFLKLQGDEEIIDASAQHAYPGLIAANTTLGLVEIEAVRSTRDFNETGNFNPNVRTLTAYNTDSKIIPTVRSNGIVLAEIAPLGGVISGTSSIVQTDAWNWEDAAYATDVALHIQWPSRYIKKGWWAQPEPGEANKQYYEKVKEIEDFFADAYSYYLKTSIKNENLKLAALQSIFQGKKKLMVHVNGANEIRDVIRLKKKYNLQVVLVGGIGSISMAEEIKENKIAIIYDGVHELPDKIDDPVDLPFETPALLQKSGISFGIALSGSWQVRNLPFVAGTAVGYGLSKEQALSAITLNMAQILGIADKTGSIEVGKDANIILSNGDILDMKSSVVTLMLIQGRKVNLNNHQNDLYQKFSNKYKQP